ncbi:hypothetical protein D3C87_1595750 [compost metagenome]
MEGRQRRGQLAHVADRAHIEAKIYAERSQDDDADQWRRDGARHQWKKVDDPQRRRDQDIGHRRHAGQFRQLRHEDQDRQRIDETGHDRFRDEAHHHSEFEKASGDLQQPGQDTGSEQIFEPVILHQRRHQNGGGSRCGRNHA